MRYLMLTAAIGALAWNGACADAAPEQTRLTISSGPKDATYALVGEAVGTAYTQALPTVRTTIANSGGSGANIEAVESGRAELGLVTADSAYAAFTRGTAAAPTPHRRLRGMAVLFPNALHIVVRRASPIMNLADLQGKLIGVGRPGQTQSETTVRSGNDVAATTAAIVAEHVGQLGLTREIRLAMDDVAAQLRDSRIDAGLLYGGPPFRPVTLAAELFDMRLVEIDDAALSMLRVRYPFFKRAVVAANTYRGQDHPVATAAVDNLLVCRDDLPDELVYRLTRAFYEAMPWLMRQHPSLSQVNTEVGPETPIPLHPGAARYYRERELLR